MRIVLMGMPGVGKGTQAARLAEAFGAQHVSTGDMLRDAIEAGSTLGRRVKEYLDSGTLVPDTLIGEVIEDRLSDLGPEMGVILDGFPRTVEQVKILDEAFRSLGVRLDAVFLLTAPEVEVVRRLSGRRICPSCGAVYHIEGRPPRSAGVCDSCGAALVQRSDDTEEVIRDRLEVFRRQTLPIAEVYRDRDLLAEVDGTGDPQTVFERLRTLVERL
jgi:adenylate kinase